MTISSICMLVFSISFHNFLFSNCSQPTLHLLMRFCQQLPFACTKSAFNLQFFALLCMWEMAKCAKMFWYQLIVLMIVKILLLPWLQMWLNEMCARLSGLIYINAVFAAQICIFALKQQHVALRWHNLPFYKAVNDVIWCFIRKLTRMSRDSSNLAQLKLVISINHRVDNELARYRHRNGCFPKPIVCSNFSMWAFVLQPFCGKL